MELNPQFLNYTAVTVHISGDRLDSKLTMLYSQKIYLFKMFNHPANCIVAADKNRIKFTVEVLKFLRSGKTKPSHINEPFKKCDVTYRHLIFHKFYMSTNARNKHRLS